MMPTLDNGILHLTSPRSAGALGKTLAMLPARLQTVTSLGATRGPSIGYLPRGAAPR
jgi:hypothetical protein